MFRLTIIGSNSAVPAYGRNPTAQVLHTKDENILIDCGEGTQLRLAQFKVKATKISHIFISHLHGDHYFGLIGLLSSMALQQRQQPIHLYAPAPLKEIIDMQLKVAECILPYSLHFHPLGDEEGFLAETNSVRVSCFKMSHRIPCWGFVFEEKKNPRKIDPIRVQSYGVPPQYYGALQKGEDYVHPKGTIVPNDELTIPNEPAIKYAYCGDTKYSECILPFIKDATVLYHETTYLKDFPDKAANYFHSTTEQAAKIASLANVKKLMIGHFSSKYEDVQVYLDETKTFFPETELAMEGVCYIL
jgi:ribonuclease Z